MFEQKFHSLWFKNTSELRFKYVGNVTTSIGCLREGAFLEEFASLQDHSFTFYPEVLLVQKSRGDKKSLFYYLTFCSNRVNRTSPY